MDNENSNSIVREGLESLRKRLLDLSKRNKLLNFRHSNKSSLRVVDELPDELFRRLTVQEAKLAFKPVPDPEQKTNDELNTPDPPFLFVGDAEPSIEGHKKVSAKDCAESLGIKTSFDLPESGNQNNPLHFDKYIQTLHYPADLENILRKISGSARTVLEESGTNMLYLIFGFLEWYEDPNSSQPLFAPLVSLPVQISKNKPSKATGGAYEFVIEHTGEDLLTNLSLLERMKAFGISLPELGDDDTPETYFKRLSGVVESKPKWRIRRQISLSLLHFGKLLMYQDLSPSRNPDILQHPRVAELLGSRDCDQEMSYAETYELDSASLAAEIPPLVFDADSTQHSALIDALRGKNLVIEGPPGTGKSQTIANLITAALIKGETVLFVSEKLAALEVVRRRLDQAGLGHFCLELHSHRTNKNKFLKDLQERIAATFPQCEELAEKKEMLERYKTPLTEYVHSIGCKIGRHNKTAFEVLWAHDQYLQKYVFLEPLTELLSFGDEDNLSLAEEDNLRLCVDVYSQQLATLIHRHGSVSSHPWAGIQDDSFTYRQEKDLAERSSAMLTCLETLIAVTEDLSKQCPNIEVNTIPAAEALSKVQRFLPQPEGVEWTELIGTLSDAGQRKEISNFLDSLNAWESSRDQSEVILADLPPIDSLNIVAINQSILPLIRYGLGGCTTPDLPGLISQLWQMHHKCMSINTFFEKCLALLQVDYPTTFDHIPDIVKTIGVLAQTKAGLLDLRHNSLKDPGKSATRQMAKDEAFKIARWEEILSREYFLDRLPSPEILRGFETAVSSSPLLIRIFGSRYKDAKKHYRAFRKEKVKIKRSTMALDFQELAEYRTSLRAFSNNRQYQNAWGNAFDGIRTPFKDLEEVQAWYVKLNEDLTPHLPRANTLLDAVEKQSTEKLKDLTALIKEKPNIGQDLVALREDLDQSDILALIDEHWKTKSLSEIASILKDAAEAMDHSLNLLATLRLPPKTKINKIAGILDRASELAMKKQELDQNQAASTILGSKFKGCRTEKVKLQSSLSLAESINGLELPAEIKNWLTASDCVARLSWLNEALKQIAELVTQYASKWKEFVLLARLDEAKWFGSQKGDGAIGSLKGITERLARAVNNTDDLSEWIEYVRCVKPLKDSNRETLISLGEEGIIKPDQLSIAHDFGICNSLTKLVRASNPNLMNFSRVRHETVRAKFADTDKELLIMQRKQAAYEISKRRTPQGIGHGPVRNYTELALIKNEIGKQRGHITIRSLMNRATDALRSLKPCFMMGPMSVSQYLDPRKFRFDLVVMDEASQLKPEEALGAVARGGQVVIVGDPKQLPPTSFFDSLFDDEDYANEEDDDRLAIEKSESILDRAAQVYQPIRQLRWHYRSRHESLIAYSNHEFYDGNLILFPSPHNKSTNLGIKVHQVSEGTWDGKMNKPEAQRVVQSILTHMTDNPNESLGVATLNSAQRDLIEELFDQAIKRDPSAQSYISRWSNSPEPFFIKNLETVQGDERDCIFISFTYSPMEGRGGHIDQRSFGPLNGPNGHRRLNVLFTRSKLRMEIFTSMDHEQIRIGSESAWGAKALKGFLKFARLGLLEPIYKRHTPEPSPFALAVRDALKQRGFDVYCEVGVAGYFIDLAIANPDRPGSFVLGIECDGATYHSAKSARDRDRLREENLVGLGWKIHRIWSSDWFRNKKAEITRLEARARDLIRQHQCSIS